MLYTRLLVQMGTRGSQGQGEYRLPNARNPPFHSSEYQKRPQLRTEQEKPLWTLPALNQPAIDFWQGSLNGCYTPICNRNEFHYKVSATHRVGDRAPTAMRHSRKKKRAVLSFRPLSVSGDNATPRWLKTQNNRRAIRNAAYYSWPSHTLPLTTVLQLSGHTCMSFHPTSSSIMWQLVCPATAVTKEVLGL